MKRAALTSVSVAVSPEAEEAVSFFLEEIFGQTPVSYRSERTGRIRVSVHLEDPESLPHKLAALRERLTTLKRNGLGRAGRIQVKKLPPEDWAESWKKHFRPIRIGRSLLLRPSWSQVQAAQEAVVVTLDPGLSFGTGQHATTHFCLEQLVNGRGEGKSFLDIGTGSGILAIAACKLGYAPVHAFDFDPESVRVCRENARINGVANQIKLRHADLTTMAARGHGKFDVICANLIYDLLIAEGRKIIGWLKPGGTLVLAGILRTQFPKVEKHFAGLGMELKKSRCRREWRSGAFARSGKAARQEATARIGN